MYRSTDKETMDNLKTAVLTVTKGEEKHDRKYAIDYLRTHVKIDDLHKLAVKNFPRREISFGTGSYMPKIVILTRNPIEDNQKEKLEVAWEKMKLHPDDVYYAHLRFVPTKKKQDKRNEIVGKLLDILKPTVVLAFDDVMVETKADVMNSGLEIKILTDSASKEDTRKLTSLLKEIKSKM